MSSFLHDILLGNQMEMNKSAVYEMIMNRIGINGENLSQ